MPEQTQPAAPDRSRFAKNTAYQFALQIARYAFPLITLPYLTRVLTPEPYAVRAYVVAAMTFMLVFLNFGFHSYGTRAIAEANGDKAAERTMTSAISILRVALCAAGAIIMAIIVPFVPLLAANPLYVVIAYVETCLRALIPDFVFQGQEDMGIITRRYVGSQTVAVILIFLCIHGPEDLILVPTFELAASAIALVWSWENVLRVRKITFCRVAREKLREVLAGSSVFFVATAATTLFNAFTTLLIGIVFANDAALVSYWSIAMTAIGAMQALYVPINNSFYPHMVKRRDFDLLKKLLLFGVPAFAAITIPYAILSDWVMLILGGPDYVQGAYVITMTAPILPFSYPAVLLGFPVLGAIGWEKQLTATSVITAVYHISGMLILLALGMFTIPAVAALRCTTEVVLLISRAYYVRKYIKQNGTGTPKSAQ